MSASTEQFPVELQVPVAWGDMDAFGHVNNTVYLRWFESGRIAYFDVIGVNEIKTRTNIGPILARATCDFKIPLEFPDVITIRARISKLGNTSFTMNYQVASAKHDGQLAAQGQGVVVMLDYNTGTKVAIPDGLRQRISELEGGQ